MYPVDQDRVVEVTDVPRPSVGAPMPRLVTDEHKCFLAYNTWREDDTVALVELKGSRATMVGPPNDEAFAGHPLAARGLEPYGVYEVLASSWIRQLERMNSVHRDHRPERYEKLRHFMFTFHDSTFECVSEGYAVTTFEGLLDEATRRMAALLDPG